MEVRIQSIHFDTSQQLEEFVNKKVGKLERFHDGIISAEITLKVVKPETANNKEASIKLIVPSQEFFAEKITDTFEASVDEAIEALQKQLVKFKEKQRAK